MAEASTEVWPYAGTPNDGLWAVIVRVMLLMRATSFECRARTQPRVVCAVIYVVR
jgi:hypothetical protein